MNAIVIEQTRDETKLAFEVHQNASLQKIRLARAKLFSRAISEMTGAPVDVEFDFKSRALQSTGSVLRLEISFRVAGILGADEGSRDSEQAHKEPVVSVNCEWEVEYKLREGFRLTPKHIRAFRTGNAIFNTWPYFREYLQENSVRMGYPPIVAPFLRLQPKAVAPKSEAG